MKDSIEPTGQKFSDPLVTAKGEERAQVALSNPDTLWFNTGTLCNIECPNCYILSSPKNDALVYLKTAEVQTYLTELEERNWNLREIAFTGGEPFMNPNMIDMAQVSLEAGYEVLILSNAMRPMMRKSVKTGLIDLNRKFGDKLTIRVSLDHWSPKYHDKERGTGGFEKSLIGMRWLRDQNIAMTVAGRTMWKEAEADARAGYAALFQREDFKIDAYAPGETVLFPEMDETADVPEITTDCWDILGKSPQDIMCASSRMVVKRKGADAPSVVACTLLPYAPDFDLGATLKEAERPVRLNHPHCSKFCVLGGASCSV